MSVVGTEWLVDASGIDASVLADRRAIVETCELVLRELNLHVVGEPHVHQFADPPGMTALYLLSESHLACHTYPELGVATFNLYCCKPLPAWPWKQRLIDRLHAKQVTVVPVVRGAVGDQLHYHAANGRVSEDRMTGVTQLPAEIADPKRGRA